MWHLAVLYAAYVVYKTVTSKIGLILASAALSLGTSNAERIPRSMKFGLM